MLLLALTAALATSDVATPVTPNHVDLDDRVQVVDAAQDVFAIAGRVDIDAAVEDNVFAIAGDLLINQPVAGDVYAMGGKVVIDAPVDGDLYGFGGEVRITERGSVAGSIRVGTGELTIDGPVGGNVTVKAGEAMLNGSIAGNVEVEAGRVAVGPQLAIGGDLDYTTGAKNLDLEGRVSGVVTYEQKVVTNDLDIEITTRPAAPVEEGSSFVANTVWWGGMTAWGYLTKLMVGCLIFLLGGQTAAAVGREMIHRPGRSLGVGFLVSVLVPVLSTAALVLILPFPLGLVGWTVFALSLYLAQIFAAQAVGDFVLRRFQPDALGSPYISLAVGLVPLALLFSLPWLGNLAWFVTTLAGLGAMSAVTWNRR